MLMYCTHISIQSLTASKLDLAVDNPTSHRAPSMLSERKAATLLPGCQCRPLHLLAERGSHFQPDKDVVLAMGHVRALVGQLREELGHRRLAIAGPVSQGHLVRELGDVLNGDGAADVELGERAFEAYLDGAPAEHLAGHLPIGGHQVALRVPLHTALRASAPL